MPKRDFLYYPRYTNMKDLVSWVVIHCYVILLLLLLWR